VSQLVYLPSMACVDSRGFKCTSAGQTSYMSASDYRNNETLPRLMDVVRLQEKYLISGGAP
jgi:hypothetical protein